MNRNFARLQERHEGLGVVYLRPRAEHPRSIENKVLFIADHLVYHDFPVLIFPIEAR